MSFDQTAGTGNIRKRIVAWLATRLGVEPAAVHSGRPFSQYGLGSLDATELLRQLSAELDREIPVTVIWSHPTADALAAALAGHDTDSRDSSPPGAVRQEPIAVTGMACRFSGGVDIGACPAPDEPFDTVSDLTDEELLTHLAAMGGVNEQVLASNDLRHLLLRVLRADLAVRESFTYQPGAPLPCPISVFLGRNDTYVPRSLVTGWCRQTSTGCSIHELEGGHFFNEAGRRQLLTEISQAII